MLYDAKIIKIKKNLSDYVVKTINFQSINEKKVKKMVDDINLNYGDQIVLFADFDSANMARYEKVLVGKASSNDNNNLGNNKNSYTISTNNGGGGGGDNLGGILYLTEKVIIVNK